MPRFCVPAVALRALMVLAVASGALMSSSAAASAAAEDDTADIRWSVRPADESGADERSAIEHALDPGEGVEDSLAVRNLSRVGATFRLLAADGFTTRTGRFDILPADQESVGAGTWVTLPEQVTVGPGETALVPFAIAVPEDAEPGDHAAGITASVSSVQSDGDGAQVGVESRVGLRVITRVNGEIAPGATISGVDPGYEVRWNPARPGSATVTFDVLNDGNTRLLAEGSVAVGGQEVAFPSEEAGRQELLPGDSRTVSVEVDDVWPLVSLPVTVELDPVVLTVDGSTPEMTPVTAEVRMWAVPWPQLLVLLGLALVAYSAVGNRRRRRRRLDILLARARDEGRRSVSVPAP
ncbi:hypothetical protein J4G33_09690 [Actinotalea sp. BY-33]|uniref:DUF916 domain-containing protein n=1 Tax=Actinotalea soli TaxID=2819234 RepID=A0A939LTY1_9CELL|nr:hypothetical protein [Actinotalea soli]MBO1752074.1 hypothetical protein [Actinotalea soli]